MAFSKTRQNIKKKLLAFHKLTLILRKLESKNPEEPFVCIITPVYDQSLTSLKKLIKDLKKQSLDDFKHILISNGPSPDIEMYIKQINITESRFEYIELDFTPTPNFASLMSNLGMRRDYCLKNYSAKRYLFLDADVHIIDIDYFSKLYFSHITTNKEILVVSCIYHGFKLPMHPINKEGLIQIGNYCISSNIAKKYRYPTQYDTNKEQGNDWRYWIKISKSNSILFLDFIATTEGDDRSYKRATDIRLEDRYQNTIISVFGNTFYPEDGSNIDKVLQSHLVGKGSIVTEFETKFRKHIGFKYAVSTNSCTNAFWILLKALNFKSSDEILIPSIHFFGVKNALDLLRLNYNTIDVDSDIPNISFDAIKHKITKKTKAIITLDYGGYPTNSKKIKKHLNKIGRKDIILILDAANSPFTKLNNQYIALDYDFAIYSFDMNKIIVTGDGGMILSNKEKELDRCRSLSYYGIKDKNISGFSKSVTNNKWWEIESYEPSLKFAMNNISATLGLSQLKNIKLILGKRNTIKKMYYTKLKHLVKDGYIELPPIDSKVDNSNYLFWLKVKSEYIRDELAYFLLRKSIYSTVKYQPLGDKKTTPIAVDFFERSLCIPLNQNMDETIVDYIVSQLIDYFYE